MDIVLVKSESCDKGCGKEVKVKSEFEWEYGRKEPKFLATRLCGCDIVAIMSIVSFAPSTRCCHGHEAAWLMWQTTACAFFDHLSVQISSADLHYCIVWKENRQDQSLWVWSSVACRFNWQWPFFFVLPILRRWAVHSPWAGRDFSRGYSDVSFTEAPFPVCIIFLSTHCVILHWMSVAFSLPAKFLFLLIFFLFSTPVSTWQRSLWHLSTCTVLVSSTGKCLSVFLTFP